MTHDESFPFDEEEDEKSKTRVKQEMQALRDLGADITKLTKEQQAKIPLDDTLRQAIEESPRITSNSAKKRHMQFIGKLLRGAEHEEIKAAYDELMEASHRLARQSHLLEQWRDELINSPEALPRFIEQYPHVERQQLRQLCRAAQKEAAQNKPPASARKLFRLIRDTVQNDPS